MGATATYNLFKEIYARVLSLHAPALLFAREEQFRLEGPGSSADSLLGYRSGKLTRSFAPGGALGVFEVQESRNDLTLAWGTRVKYAGYWEPIKPFVEPAMLMFQKKDLPKLNDKAMNEFRKQFDDIISR